MAKKNVIIFDGEDKFINKKKHVYSKNRGVAEYVNVISKDDTIDDSALRGDVVTSAQSVDTTPTTTSSVVTETITSPKVETGLYTPPPSTSTPTPESVASGISGAISSALSTSSTSGGTTCPPNMRSYFGTCIPIRNEYADCPQGWYKPTIGADCQPIPQPETVGQCAAGFEYKMGYKPGDLTATMGCYPIGSTQDIGTGSSTGGILGGGSGTNIGGGGNVQGGGGNYAETPEGKIGIGAGKTSPSITCNENQVFDPVSGSCIAKENPTIGAVVCPPGQVLDPNTGRCIVSTNPEDYKCPPPNLGKAPDCKKWSEVGKDAFGCPIYQLVDDDVNCSKGAGAVTPCSPPSEAPAQCMQWVDKGGCNWVLEPITTGNCAEIPCPSSDYVWDKTSMKCVPKESKKCPDGFIFSNTQNKCIEDPFAPTTSTTTTTTTKKGGDSTSTTTTTTTKKGTVDVKIDNFGTPPSYGGGVGGGGGGGSEEAPKAVAKAKNYFWYYVAAGMIGFYLYRKFKK